MTENQTPQDRTDLSAIPSQQQEWPGTGADLTPEPDYGETSWTARGRLEGKKALITGGDSGIGRAVATIFALEGADVVIACLPEEAEDAAEVKKAVEAAGRRCEVVPGDLRDAAANKELLQKAVAFLGGLDVLVANAAYQMTHGAIEEFPDEQIERTFATNVFSPFWLVKHGAEHLAQGGSVIITSSVQAYSPSDHLLDYAATKAALTNLTVNLAAELGEKGIRVNSVAPGPIWTPLIPATMSEQKVEGFGSDTPLGRAGHPVEVAAAYVFLASEEASYVSATVIGVTGGKPVF